MRAPADLLRLAYLALDDGGAPDVTLSRARRAVRRARAARRPRERLAELLLDPPGTPRLVPHRLLFTAAAPPRGPTRTALLRLSPHERLVYLLHRLEGLSPAATATMLSEKVLVNAWDVQRTAADVDLATELDAAAQRAELEAFDPALVRLRPPRHVPRAWLVGPLALALALALFPWSRPPDPSLTVDDARWRRTDMPTLDHWPTGGALRGDRALLDRAAAAWRAHHRIPPLGRVTVLHADTVDGVTVVVMRDSPGHRDSPMAAQYFERPLSRGVESVNRLRLESGGLIPIDGTWRYLVPPWLTDLRMAMPSADPRWRLLAVRDGMTERVHWSWFTPRCQFYVLFHMVHRSAGGRPRPVVQLAGQTGRAAAPRVWFRGEAEHDVRFQNAALHAIACQSVVSFSEAADVRVSRLWSGRLPDGGGRATLTIMDVSAPWGTPGTAVLLDDTGRALTERGGTNGGFVRDEKALAAAVWWRSPRRWHLIAAGGPEVATLRAVGELGGHHARGPHAFLQVKGPPPRTPPLPATYLPQVWVVADESDGDHTTATPAWGR